MLDAYNVFNYPQNSHVQNKYSHNHKRNLRNQQNKSKIKDGEVGLADRNRSLNEKLNSRNDKSPGYPNDKSVILPELSRSPNMSLISGRKRSIISLKKKHHDKYIQSLQRRKDKSSSIPKQNANKSTDLESMPSISKKLDRILNSHKISIDKTSTNNHYKIKSISNDKDRRELAIDGLPSSILKPGNRIRPKDRRKDISSLASLNESKV